MIFSRMRRDDGQVSLAVILLSVMILAAAIGAFIFGEATDVRARAQKAADAAALAAARDSRDQFIRTYTASHIPPTNVSEPVLGSISAAIASSNQSGRAAAGSFASKNQSAVTSYRAAGDLITVSVKSDPHDVVSPVGKKAQSTLSSPATATAQVGTTGMSCTHTPVQRDQYSNPIQWKLICTGNGAQATATYYGYNTVSPDVAANMDEWRKLLKIKLVSTPGA